MSDATDAWICWDALIQALLGETYPDQKSAMDAATAHWRRYCQYEPFIPNPDDLTVAGYEIMRHSDWLMLRQIEADAALSG